MQLNSTDVFSDELKDTSELSFVVLQRIVEKTLDSAWVQNMLKLSWRWNSDQTGEQLFKTPAYGEFTLTSVLEI